MSRGSGVAHFSHWMVQCSIPADLLDDGCIDRWLGHESPTTTHQYTQANLATKEKALAKLKDPGTQVGRLRASDSLLDFLKKL